MLRFPLLRAVPCSAMLLPTVRRVAQCYLDQEVPMLGMLSDICYCFVIGDPEQRVQFVSCI